MIIFLHGPDTFRSRQKLKRLKDKFKEEVDKSGLNLAILDGEKLEISEFETAISTPPFLAKKRMVVVENLIKKSRKLKIHNEILELLKKNNLDDIILIFWEADIAETKRKAKTTKSKNKALLQKLKNEKYVQEFQLFNLNAAKKWVTDEIKNRGGAISLSAVNLLVDFVGNDIWQLNSEIDKLIAYAKNREITNDDIQKSVKTKLDDDIFKLTDAIGRKDKATALKLISDQLTTGTAPTELLSKIVWQFRNLLLIKSFMEENGPAYPAQQLAFQVGLHPFVVKKTLAQSENYTLAGLKQIYSKTLKIDHKIKTSRVDPEVLFDLLVIKS